MRHGGLDAAAAELSVTVSAVSHQIRTLEADLEVKLTRRDGRRLRATAAGEALLPGLTKGFASIVAAVALVTQSRRDGPVTIAMLQTFALHWLVPRLPAFERAQPLIEVRLALDSRPVDFAREEVDLAILFGRGPWPGLACDLLFEDALLPVCSPGLLAGDPPLREPADLARHTLLASASRAEAWSSWLAAAGVPGLRPARTQSFETTNLALQAAARGLGVALVGRRLARNLIEARWLVQPFQVALPDTGAYYLTAPAAWAHRRSVRTLRAWILDEAAREDA